MNAIWTFSAGALLVVSVCLVGIGQTVKHKEHRELPVKCRALPSHVVEYGIAVHNTSDGLYLCFQQAALNGNAVVQGMTEITCVPMKDCR